MCAPVLVLETSPGVLPSGLLALHSSGCLQMWSVSMGTTPGTLLVSS